MAQIDVCLTSKDDTVVVSYPPEWDVAVLQKKSVNSHDPVDMFSTVGIKVKSA